jgi:uncharacterized damage-inducible protein DinB
MLLKPGAAGWHFIELFCAILPWLKPNYMMIEILKSLFNRDLERLKNEIGQYKDESMLWQTDKNISNSAGNLCLHLIGNLNSFIGATLGGSGYIRNRELEFVLKDVAREELLAKIDETVLTVNSTLDKLTEIDLANEYPVLILEKKINTRLFLCHLTTHLSYHLGQINYHRRLLDK